MADDVEGTPTTETAEPAALTRDERLAAQRDAYREWAATATTDEIPPDIHTG